MRPLLLSIELRLFVKVIYRYSKSADLDFSWTINTNQFVILMLIAFRDLELGSFKYNHGHC